MKNKQTIVVLGALLALVLILGAAELFTDIKIAGSLLNSGKKTEKIIDESWTVFESYMNYAREHDLEGVASLSRDLGPICKDPNKKSECDALLDTVAFFGSQLKREKFTGAWYDSKQVIIFTDYERNEDADGVVYARGVIYLVRDENKDLKLLSFNHIDGVVILKSDERELPSDEAMQEMVRDSDKDGLPDKVETCSDENDLNRCTNTDPNKRDTDGDSWWDGIQVLFR